MLAICTVPARPLFSQVPCATQVAYQRPTAGMAVGFLVAVGIAAVWVVRMFLGKTKK